MSALALTAILLATPLPPCEHRDRAIVDEESSGAWQLLFDGKTLDGWAGFQRDTIPDAWHVADGALTVKPLEAGESYEGRGDIRTESVFGSFELRFQWAVAPGGNSGVFFHAREGVEDRVWKSAPEVQIIDDARHEDAAEPSHRSGGLYDLYAPACDSLKPAGEYNDTRLIVRGTLVEHWLNGYRVASYDTGSEDFRSRVARSKFRGLPAFARFNDGFLVLQDHGDAVRFRTIRIRAF